jgi:hypothetical protein
MYTLNGTVCAMDGDARNRAARHRNRIAAQRGYEIFIFFLLDLKESRFRGGFSNIVDLVNTNGVKKEWNLGEGATVSFDEF